MSAAVHRRGTASNINGSDILSVLSTVADNSSKAGQDISDKAATIKSELQQRQSTQQTSTSSSVESAFSAISSIFQNGVSDLAQAVEELLSQGLLTGSLLELLNGYADFSLNSDSNNNPKSPATPIYPSKSSGDAPYSVDEATLRAAIYIPESFSYGANGKIPVILVPGTAVPAGVTYYFSFSKLGSAVNVDPVWVNIPKASLGDVRVNAEYVAYAINYISGISASSNVSVISWSQGGLNTQWALKYWPSTRTVVSDFIAVSPDFHGTVEAFLTCPGLPSVVCTPALAQQYYDSSFIETLRADGGDSAYVPTTTLYSSFDEIVEPMSGTTTSSAFLQDARGVGVTNNWVQAICAGQAAGGVYTHEGMLYNPLSWALAIDAITHDGPGDPSRLDLGQVCSQILPPQLGLSDMLGTEGLLLIAVAEILAYSL
ncbi:hypothetical protein VTN77DRAFT_1737 [Rasamsonia byssochlamydoides]|uniref:uncharacterized protein n=1 Tax=Rasamsonia byssochlamydoides TaxID=89139 RepID=UPI003744728E